MFSFPYLRNRMKWCQPTIHASWQRKTSVSALLRVFCFCCAELSHRPIIFHLPSFPGPGFSSPPCSWFSGTFSQADSMSLSWASAVIRAVLLRCCVHGERHGHTGKSPTESRQDDKWSRASLLWGEAEEAGTVQLGRKEAWDRRKDGGSCQCP